MGFFNSLFGEKKGKSAIGVDIGSSSIKVVQLRKQGGAAVLETYGELALGPYAGGEIGQATNLSAEQITESLKDLLRESKVTTNEAGVSIPFSRSFLTIVELPRRDSPEEQKTLITLEARKYIPVPVNEVQLDWFILPEPPSERAVLSSKIKVLLVAVHNDQLTLLHNVITGAELNSSFYEIEIFSTIRAVIDEQAVPVLVLDIGAAATKAYVVERGVVAASHSIRKGGQDITRTISGAHGLSLERAEALKKQHGFKGTAEAYTRETLELTFSHIFDEVRKVISQFESTQNKSVSTLILTGGTGVTPELVSYAQSFLSMQVILADPFARVAAPAFMRPVLKEIGPEFAVSVGLALRKLEEMP